MTTTCPACNKSVDPLRSRFVGVVDGKVVAYCSAECAPAPRRTTAMAAIAPAPTVAATPAPTPAATSGRSDAAASRRTPASGIPEIIPMRRTPVSGVPVNLDSGPVIEIVHEPASGVVGVVSAAADERSEPRAKHPDEIAIGAFWTADKQKTGQVPAVGKTVPVPAASDRDDTLDRWATDDPSQSGVARATSTGAVESMRPRSRVPIILVIVLVLGAGGFLAYQFLVKRSVAASAPAPASLRPAASAPAVIEPGQVAAGRSSATAQRSSASVSVATPTAEALRAAPVDPAKAVVRARDLLRSHLTATSLRVARIAAAALARTGDPAACEVLAGQLGLSTAAGARPSGAPRDGDTIARLDLAYSLARAGDKRGADTLAAALISPSAEARDEGARLLALLGDKRAVPRLTDVLAVSQRRLGAAEHLAHLAEPHAVKVLEQILDDAKASADDKARAVVALGYAGRADVAPALRDMLRDTHFNAFAAAALAELKDSAARAALERQLDSPALRVRSARALRRLDPALDAAPLLPRLLAILDAGDAGDAGRDLAQVQAAEAILLLAGPPAWSAFD